MKILREYDKWRMVANLKKVFQILKYFTSPPQTGAYGRGKGGAHIFYCEMFIIGRNLTFFSCVDLTSYTADTVNIFCKFKCAK